MSLDFKLKRTLRGLSFAPKFWDAIWLGPLAPDEISDLFNEKVNWKNYIAKPLTRGIRASRQATLINDGILREVVFAG